MSNPKLISRIVGGIGNRLCYYAAARCLVLINNAELMLDGVTGFLYDAAYRRHYQLDHFIIPCGKTSVIERLEPFSRLRRPLERKWNQLKQFEQRKYLLYEDADYDPLLPNFEPQGTVYLEEYWQSKNYVKDVKTTIREDLHIKSPTDNSKNDHC